MIKAFKAGNFVILNKHYWHPKGKRYPSFSLNGFTKAYTKYIEGNEQSEFVVKDFDPAGLRCKKNGPRKIVWINTSHGTYALNGHAITWLKRNKSNGSSLLGTDGKEWKMGRDYIDHSKMNLLIQQGLKKCN